MSREEILKGCREFLPRNFVGDGNIWKCGQWGLVNKTNTQFICERCQGKLEGYDQALQDVLEIMKRKINKLIVEDKYPTKDEIQQLTSQAVSKEIQVTPVKEVVTPTANSFIHESVDKEQESFLSEKAKSFGYSLDSPVATAGKPKELPVSNLDKAKALEISNKFWHKEFLNNQLNNDIRQMIIKEAKKLLKEIEMGCGKRTIVDVGEPKYMLECGRNTKYILWFCDDCEQAKKICEDILRC